MPNPLTPRQKQILEFINRRIKIQGSPPHLREIAKAVGLSSPANIHRTIIELEKKGYVRLRRSSEQITPTSRKDINNGARLTSTEARVHECVLSSIGASGVAPTVRNIARKLGNVSVGNVHTTLRSLEQKGYLALSPRTPYGISLVKPADTTLYPVFHSTVPCSAKAFLSSEDGVTWVESMQLPLLVPNFVEADAAAIFSVVLTEHRGLHPFLEGDEVLMNRQLGIARGDVVAVKYKNRVIVRYCMDTFRASQIRLSCKQSGIKKGEKHNSNDVDDIVANHEEARILGVAVAAIVRNIGTRTPYSEAQEL